MEKYVILGQNLFVNTKSDYELSEYENSTLVDDVTVLENTFNKSLQDIYDFAKLNNLEFSPTHTNQLMCYLEYSDNYSEIQGQYFEVQNHIAIMRYTDMGGLLVDNVNSENLLPSIVVKELLNFMFTNIDIDSDKDGNQFVKKYYLGTCDPYNMITGEIELKSKYGYMLHEMLVSYLTSLIAKTDYKPYNDKWSEIIKKLSLSDIFNALKTHDDSDLLALLNEDDKQTLLG